MCLRGSKILNTPLCASGVAGEDSSNRFISGSENVIFTALFRLERETKVFRTYDEKRRVIRNYMNKRRIGDVA